MAQPKPRHEKRRGSVLSGKFVMRMVAQGMRTGACIFTRGKNAHLEHNMRLTINLPDTLILPFFDAVCKHNRSTRSDRVWQT